MRCRSECSAGLSVGPECFSHLYIGPELSALAVGARLITFILSCQFLVQTSYLPLNVNKVPAKLNNNIWGQCSCTVAGQRPSHQNISSSGLIFLLLNVKSILRSDLKPRWKIFLIEFQTFRHF